MINKFLIISLFDIIKNEVNESYSDIEAIQRICRITEQNMTFEEIEEILEDDKKYNS